MRKLRKRHRRRLLRAGAAALVMLIAGGALSSLESVAPAASAAAAEPKGAAMAPKVAAAVPAEEVLYAEDFENRARGSVVLITDYTRPDGGRYGADPLWSSLYACNGFILDQYSQHQGRVCEKLGKGATVFADLQRLVLTLGEHLHGKDTPASRTNASMAALTEDPTGNDTVMLRTVNLLDFGNTGQFVTFGVDVAAMNCNQKHPRLSFSLVPDRVTADTPRVDVAEVNGCELPNEREFTVGGKPRPVKYGPLVSDGALLVKGGKYRLVMENKETSGGGNDAAVDNFKLVNGTPMLDKSFSPASVPVDGRSTYTFTITNTTENAAKSGWGFTDALPKGLVIAPAPNTPTWTCESATVTAPVGGTSIRVSAGKLRKKQESCTISVNVTSNTPKGGDASPKPYTTGAANLTQILALRPPGTATVEFYSEPKLGMKKTTTAGLNTRVGDTVSYTVTATNTGTGDYTADNKARFVDDLAGLLDDAEFTSGTLQVKDEAGTVQRTEAAVVSGGRIAWEGVLKVGHSATLRYGMKVKPGGDGKLNNTAFASAPNAPSEETPACTPSTQTATVVCTATLLPRLTVAKTAQRSERPVEGETVTYTVDVKNEGPGAFTDGAPAMVTDDLSEVLDDAVYNGNAVVTPNVGVLSQESPRLSWRGALAAGKSVRLSYSVTLGAVGDGTAKNVAFVGSGLTPACSATEQEAKSCSVVQYPVLRPGVTWQKVATPSQHGGGSGTLLRGSEWRLARLGPDNVEIAGQTKHVVDCVEASAAQCEGADKDPAAGKFLVKPLAAGRYQLTETKAPAGYKLREQPEAFTISADNLNAHSNLDLGEIENTQQVVPLVPLTGGLGEHSFVIAAGAAALIAATGIGLRLRGRRRGAAHAE